jgi:hypothetical protein
VNDFAAFARLIEALGPWLNQLVIVGGWAHRLYRFDRLAQPLPYRPLMTKDADVAFASNAPLTGDIGAALAGAGFEQKLSGEHIPPITEYKLGGEEQEFSAEFLTPLLGDGLKRDGSNDVTVKKAGITAQKLRYLELLLISPWSVQVSPAADVPVKYAVSVTIPNPVAFIAQKLLIHGRRRPDKRPQDVLYIHDTLDLFGHELPALHTIWQHEIKPHLPSRTAKMIDRLRRELFAMITDVHRSAARIPQDRRLTPDRLQAACAYGLEEVFGT